MTFALGVKYFHFNLNSNVLFSVKAELSRIYHCQAYKLSDIRNLQLLDNGLRINPSKQLFSFKLISITKHRNVYAVKYKLQNLLVTVVSPIMS